MRLRRSDPNKPGYGRRGSGKGFRYLDADGSPLTDAEAVAQGLTFLPRTLPEALAEVEADPVIAAAIGPVILSEFLKLKRTELVARSSGAATATTATSRC